MRIEVGRLDSSGESFAHRYGPDDLDLQEDRARLASEAVVKGRVTRKGSEVTLRGDLSANVEVDCDRCALPVALKLDVDLDVAFLPAEDEARVTENVELGKSDLVYSVYEDGVLDIDELVREQILLELPTRQLCREDCRGLCPVCGVNLNLAECSCPAKEIDPRWSALADLRGEENRKS